MAERTSVGKAAVLTRIAVIDFMNDPRRAGTEGPGKTWKTRGFNLEIRRRGEFIRARFRDGTSDSQRRERARRCPRSRINPAESYDSGFIHAVRSYTRRSNKPVAHEVNQCTRPVGTTRRRRRRRRAHRFRREIKVVRPGEKRKNQFPLTAKVQSVQFRVRGLEVEDPRGRGAETERYSVGM